MNPYGDVMADYSYGAMDSGYGFTGEQIDPNELVYLRARYYDPTVGVFASLDPFEGVHNRPMSVNGYSWVEGNVINWSDASGRCVDNMVANAIGQLTNINACNLLGFDDTACSLYTARNSTVTIAAFGVYNGPDTRSIIGMGAIVQHNGKEYLLTSDHFGSRANTCSSLYNLGIDRPFLYLEGIRGGKVFYVPNMEQSCIPQSGYTLISIKDGNQSFGITSGIAQLKTENMLNRSSGVRVAYGYISGSNRNSFQTLSKTFDIQVGTGIVTLRDIQFVYQPYSRLTFSMGSLFADSMSIPNNPVTSRWRILFGEGSQGDSGNVAFNNQYAVAVFERQDPAPYLFANLWQIPGAIITGSADFPVKDDIYAPIQHYP